MLFRDCMWLCQWYIIELCPPFVSLGTLARYRCTYTYSDQSSLARYQTDFSVTNRPATAAAAAAAATLWECHNLSYRNLPATVIDQGFFYSVLRKSGPVFLIAQKNRYKQSIDYNTSPLKVTVFWTSLFVIFEYRKSRLRFYDQIIH